MTTQVRPLTGGTWNTVSQDSLHVAKKNTTLGTTLVPALFGSALYAMNVWIDCAGVGTAAVRAQGVAAAIGLQLQEI